MGSNSKVSDMGTDDKKDEEKKEEEEAKDEEKKEEELPKVGFMQLFRYATGWDRFLIILAMITATEVGLSQPAMMIVFGDMTDSFVDAGKFAICNNETDTFNEYICELTISTASPEEQALFSDPAYIANVTKEESNKMIDQIIVHTMTFIYLGVLTWICGWISGTCITISSNRMTNRIRVKYFEKILRQDIGYFDTNSPGELNSRLFEDVRKISKGLGEKLTITMQASMQFIGGIAIGFYYGWEMTLVIFAFFPLLAGTGYVLMTITTRFTSQELEAYAKAGDISEEVFSSIRTVTAFGGQKEEVRRYSDNLGKAKEVGIKKGSSEGLALGVTYLVMFSSYALAFWYGAKLVVNFQANDDGRYTTDYTIGTVLTTFFAIIMGAFATSQIGQNAEFFVTAQAAAYSIYELIDRVPEIDIEDATGIEQISHGKVEFSGVRFTYPARKDQEVLTGVDFVAEAGQTTALCGQSGCGKSTCIGLIQRFYDAVEGCIKIDDIDIKQYNINALRNNIGIVSQEPVLFDMSIKENIQMGRLDVSDEEINAALAEANATEFISKLPGGIDAQVGEGGATLSGGQKQRIAIARALVRNPKILLLDEATSALDTESEKLVQTALEKVSQGRTTIVVAHRLSTIKNAEKIIGFANGKAVEEGNHESLSNKENGIYSNLCNMQTFAASPPKMESKQNLARASRTSLVETKTKKRSLLALISGTSLHGSENKENSEDDNEEKAPEVGLMRIWALNKPEMCYNIMGSIIALLLGVVQPLFAFVFAAVMKTYGEYACAYDANIYNAYQENNKTTNPFPSESNSSVDLYERYERVSYCDPDDMVKELLTLSLWFIAIGVADFFGHTLSHAFMAVSGQNLTMRLRRECFKKYLTLEMAYFDDPKHSTGVLKSRLATEASKVQHACSTNMMIMMQVTGSMTCGFVIAFYYSWRLTLVCFAFVPLIILSSVMLMDSFSGEGAEKELKAFEEAGKASTEATMNIRTVASLNREKYFVEKYQKDLDIPLRIALKKSWSFGFMSGMAIGIIFFMYATCFWFSGWLINNGHIRADEFDDIFKVLMGIVFAAMTAGETSAMGADIGEGTLAAHKIVDLLNKEPEIDNMNEGGKTLPSCEGNIEFDSVKFSYPTRQDCQVLKGLSLKVNKGETVALVGQSGCGKSTCIQLLERFYDSNDGTLTVDNENVNQLNIGWLRQQMGFVQQEPILFDRSIKENILYGTDGTFTDDQIHSACVEANAADFIADLPDGYDTCCGRKGSQLSGGQKQRIAIARALIRNPKILLLDEATSALDTESEKIVKDALNKARNGRTSILIAHRLSTVVNADKIAVIDNGTIVEIGTHAELIKKKGAYYSLVNTQL
jgi:ATP-binding cassette subfamily B (MDR/TAP) protein 1